MRDQDTAPSKEKRAIYLSTSTATRIECENCRSESTIDGELSDGDLVECQSCGADLIVSR